MNGCVALSHRIAMACAGQTLVLSNPSNARLIGYQPSNIGPQGKTLAKNGAGFLPPPGACSVRQPSVSGGAAAGGGYCQAPRTISRPCADR